MKNEHSELELRLNPNIERLSVNTEEQKIVDI